MKKTIVALWVLSLVILCLPSSTTYYEYIPPVKPKKAQIQEYIAKYAEEYNISPKALESTLKCESQYNPNAINYNDGGKGKHSIGVMQFQESTFNLWEKKLGEDLDYYSYHDSIKLGAYMFSKGQAKQWTCARKLGLV